MITASNNPRGEAQPPQPGPDPPETFTNTLGILAETAFEKGLGAHGIQKNKTGVGVTLYDAVVVEDDGPGAGGGGIPGKYNSQLVEVTGATRVKKILSVDRPSYAKAWLAIQTYPVPGQGEQIALLVNGAPLAYAPEANGLLPLPAGRLKKGDNEVVISCPATNSCRMSIAPRADILNNAPERRDRPVQSYKSDDGGRTWQPIDGEWYVRLHLQQYVGEGSLLSPVIDLGMRPYEEQVLTAGLTVGQLTLSWQGNVPPGSAITFAVRTGTTPVYEKAAWSAWGPADGEVPARHRYAQWQAILATSDPLVSPVLLGVTVSAMVTRHTPPDWARQVRVTGWQNQELRYTSIPYVYEDVNHPRLKALRAKYRLDEAVRGASSELEALVRLRNWVHQQWAWCPPAEPYPAWDAGLLLERKNGFCVHFAIAYMQCALSLGYQARFVFGQHPLVSGGHEVCEVWSNQYNKWIFMDAADNVHHVDPATGVPLSMLEVHDRMLKTCYGEQAAGGATRPRPDQVRNADDIGTCYQLDLMPSPLPEHHEKFERRRPWGYWFQCCMMPRNDFFSRPYPVPKTQGITWDWTGYWLWEDRQTGRNREWSGHRFTSRRSDWEWSLNRVRFAAGYGDQAGTLTVRLGTVTPGFDTFLANRNGNGWEPTGPDYTWRLTPGTNRLLLCVRTRAGITGPVSCLEVDYTKPD